MSLYITYLHVVKVFVFVLQKYIFFLINQIIIKKTATCKPGSVAVKRSIIYLGRRSPDASINLPPGNGRVSPLLPVYLVFQPIRLAITGIAAMRRELLPRVFTLTCSGTAPCLRRRYFFCGAICCPLRDTFPLGSMGPCVARTFLPPLAWPAIEQLRFFLFCKSTKKKLPTAHFFVFD